MSNMRSDSSCSQLNSGDGPDFVVHNFNYLEATQSSTLLDAAHSLICAATSPRWINVRGISSASDSPASCRRSFQYNGSTAHISARQLTEHPRPLKEWWEPIGTDDDIFDLDDLEEFEVTDLSSLWLVGSPLNEPNRTRSLSLTSIQGPPLKQRKLDIYPLHDVIPQPHIHPSPHGCSRIPNYPRYIAKNLIAIPPYALPFSASPFSRTAWLIPIRGSFSWEASTSAVILDPSFSMPASYNPKNGEPITWTHASLASFWSYLHHLRNSGQYGSIGFSFQPSTSNSPLLLSDPQSLSPNNTFSLIANQAGLESHISSDQRSMVTVPPTSRVPLSNVDHIKVYHEASNAMHVRGALFVWSYPPPLPSGRKDTDQSHGIRVLQGARLVLIDERSRGVLIA